MSANLAEAEEMRSQMAAIVTALPLPKQASILKAVLEMEAVVDKYGEDGWIALGIVGISAEIRTYGATPAVTSESP